MTATLVVIYTEALDGQSGRQAPFTYVVGLAFMSLDGPGHVAAHREITNQGPDAVLIGPHPVAARAHRLPPGETVSFQRQGTLFAGTVT